MASGEQRTVNVTFPQAYPTAHLACKNAEFDVAVKSIETPQAVTLERDSPNRWAWSRSQASRDGEGAPDARARRDVAAEGQAPTPRSACAKQQFAAPPSLVEDEFTNVWKTIVDDLQTRKRTFEEKHHRGQAKEDYRASPSGGCALASSSPRSASAQQHQGVRRGTEPRVMDRGRQVPGREQEVWILSQQSRRAGELRAPIFEDKVVDYIIELAKITDKTVSREDL